MRFWDRVVLWVYLGLGDTRPEGRDATSEIFLAAFQREHMQLPSLTDLSLLLLLAVTPTGSPLRAATETEALRRGLPQQPARCWALLQAVRPSRLMELLEVCRSPVPAVRVLLAGILTDPGITDLGPELSTFLGRLFLEDPQTRWPEAGQRIVQAINRYYRIPEGTVDFRILLYRHVLESLRLDQIEVPSRLPPGAPPPWYAALEPGERGVIEQALANLSEPDVLLFYLHLYAHLTAEQIAGVLGAADGTWTAGRIARRLAYCWDVALVRAGDG